MNNIILVNKDNPLNKCFVPDDLVNTSSKYKNNILVKKEVLENFKHLQNDMGNLGYQIDIMSGYRCYTYQEQLYNESLNNKGFANTFRSIAKPGTSEHQTGLAIDICIYRNDKCYIEKEVEDLEETKWLHSNIHKYGFILRYPKDKENITGYNYEPWHFRYLGDLAKELYSKNLTLEEYYLSLN